MLGEGAGVLVLEEYEHAKRRGARIYAELVGFGMSADAFHMTAPERRRPEALDACAALRDAGINADQVAVPQRARHLDAARRRHRDQRDQAAPSATTRKKLVVNSTKSMTGHLLGGAGGIESVFTVLAVHNQVSPPTINIFNQDPECDLDYCANMARDMKIDVRGQEQLRLRRHQRHAGLQAGVSAAPARPMHGCSSLRDRRRADSASGGRGGSRSRSAHWRR